MNESDVFSVRIVTADYYMSAPIPEMDVAFSEFRGSEIKHLPVLRIFGATAQGIKTCLHVHGVFPYLYIPCDDPQPEPKVAYQIANSIDKAINISLKQSHSNTQHVYKVILVQGIPFYGFHTKPHQFYKIFFYNPALVKRAADLLQNGAILGLSYQPHEAHINFTMQFFLDFNLYGMSFINMRHIKYRRKNVISESENFSAEDDDSYLPNTVPFTSRCECEIDCLAQNILNRNDVINGNLGANPGLASLWEDEKLRRKHLNMSETLDPTQSQTRYDAPVTDSHDFHAKRLLVKLALNSEANECSESSNLTLSILNDTLGVQASPLGERSSNVSVKSIYPAETPTESQASYANNVVLHHPMGGRHDLSKSSPAENFFVDESVVIEYSQKLSQVSLDSGDMEFIEMLKDMENKIEDDSILGSQQVQDCVEDNEPEIHSETNLMENVDSEVVTEEQNSSVAQDSDILIDQFKDEINYESDSSVQSSSVWNDTFWDNVQNISQLDGAWDDMPDDHKRFKRKLKVGLSRPVRRSTRNIKETLPNPPKVLTPVKTFPMSPKCKSIQNKIESLQNNFQCTVVSPKKSPRRPQRKLSTLRIFQESPPFREKSPFKSNRISVNFVQSQESKTSVIVENNTNPLSLSNFDLKNGFVDTLVSPSEMIELDTQCLKSDIEMAEYKTPKKTLTASQYDRQNHFIPQPGSSRIDMSDVIQCSPENDNSNTGSVRSIGKPLSLRDDSSFMETPNSKPDLGIMSFYDATMCCDKTLTQKSEDEENGNSESSALVLHYDTSPESDPLNLPADEVCKNSLKNNRGVVLTPKISPPSLQYIKSTLNELKIPHHVNEQPYYSDYKDVGHQIEVGQIILKLKSRSAVDLKPFESAVQGLNTIEKCREAVFMQSNISQTSEIKDLKSFLSSNGRCILTPATLPPTRQSVMQWLRQKETKKPLKIEQFVPEKETYCAPSSPEEDLNGSPMDLIALSPFSTLSCTPESVTYSPIVHSHGQKIVSNVKNNKSVSRAKKLLPRALHRSLSWNTNKDIDVPFSPLSSSQASNDSSETFPCAQDLPKDEFEMDKTPSKDTTITNSVINKENSINVTNTLGFKFSGENYQNAVAFHQHEFLTMFVLEILTSTRGDMLPDPEKDPILAIFYCITVDCPDEYPFPKRESGVVFSKNGQFKANDYDNLFSKYEGLNKKHCMTIVDDERAIFEETSKLILKWDPDILCGYEVEMASWGYLVQRGYVLDLNMSSDMSRVSQEHNSNWKKNSEDVKNKELKLVGRVMLDFWRIMRHEIALTSYTFENIMYHIMHERVPKFSHKVLYFWWNHPSGLLRTMSMEYYLARVVGVVDVLQHLDIVGRTSELARLFGIQWYEVLSRGSQFRVESMMCRMTRPRNYVLVSPSVQQRAAMKAPEYIPLVMEPESRFYNDPVIVLDFQSLYPSIIIAYNYCYSTCLGKVNNMGRDLPFEFGCTQLKVSPRMLERLNKKNLINWSPCGVGFVKKEIRCGVLPTMLQDILSTRLMVKKAMKKHKEDKTLQKILHSRQLGLKLIANVTYGYTAANFSGRMPCSEVGDSVVSKGRETLERAIELVQNNSSWNARVVYGDTDSIFVLVPGRSRSEAFDIGAEIAEAVTSDNPTPVKLKLEKVYQPCILQTKKRYVGYMYESKDQSNPVYDAKGIETVRRDGCPATAKILEKSLRILFETLDMSRVKTYICNEFQKMLEGRYNMKDFIFAKEFRGINSYKVGAAIPALEIARQQKAVDPRSEPREGERVPYVMVCGAPGEALMRLARPPLSLLTTPSLQLHYSYYITRQIIPPLNRCLTLMGADVNLWFADLPRKQYQKYPLLSEDGREMEGKKSTISQYFAKINCPGCETLTTQGVCEACMKQPQRTMLLLHERVNRWQRRHLLLNKICQSCCGRSRNTDCISTDCPVLFNRAHSQHNCDQIPFIHNMIEKLTKC